MLDRRIEGGPLRDSPLTDHIAVGPFADPASVFTITALDSWDGRAHYVVTWGEWLELTRAIVGSMFAEAIVPRPHTGMFIPEHLQWQLFRRNGDYAVELSHFLAIDNTYGARLVLCNGGTVLQYQPDTTTSVSAVASNASITGMMPVMTAESTVDDGFFMTVDDDAYARIDEDERLTEERYRAACEREARSLLYDIE